MQTRILKKRVFIEYVTYNKASYLQTWTKTIHVSKIDIINLLDKETFK